MKNLRNIIAFVLALIIAAANPITGFAAIAKEASEIQATASNAVMATASDAEKAEEKEAVRKEYSVKWSAPATSSNAIPEEGLYDEDGFLLDTEIFDDVTVGEDSLFIDRYEENGATVDVTAAPGSFMLYVERKVSEAVDGEIIVALDGFEASDVIFQSDCLAEENIVNNGDTIEIPVIANAAADDSSYYIIILIVDVEDDICGVVDVRYNDCVPQILGINATVDLQAVDYTVIYDFAGGTNSRGQDQMTETKTGVLGMEVLFELPTDYAPIQGPDGGRFLGWYINEEYVDPLETPVISSEIFEGTTLYATACYEHLDGIVEPEEEPQKATPSEPEPKDPEPEDPEEPEVPETPDKPEVPEVPETPDKPEVPETPKTPDAPKTPETPETPDVPETPSVPTGSSHSSHSGGSGSSRKPRISTNPAEEVVLGRSMIVDEEEPVEVDTPYLGTGEMPKMGEMTWVQFYLHRVFSLLMTLFAAFVICRILVGSFWAVMFRRYR